MCSAQLGGCFLAPRTVWLACVGRLAFLVCVCAFDGFLLWVRIASACPTIASLCNKNTDVMVGHAEATTNDTLQRRIGNPKLEQETIEGTHARETSAYQRRPTTQHAAQASNPPTGARYKQLAKIPHTHQTTPPATRAASADQHGTHRGRSLKPYEALQADMLDSSKRHGNSA